MIGVAEEMVGEAVVEVMGEAVEQAYVLSASLI